jgi:transcriptional regulator with XRE-family HTH domain
MKKDNVFAYIEKLEQNDETFKKWGELYKIEEELIQTLIDARKEKGLSQTELARLTNLKQPAIARIESGANSPQLNTIIKIANALEIKIDLKPMSYYSTRRYFDNDVYDKLLMMIDDAFEKSILHQMREYNPEIKGGCINENIPYQYLCNENYTA